MTTSSNFRSSRSNANATFGLAAVGTTAVMGLIPLTAVAGEWWLLGATFATLLVTAGLLVSGLFGLLAQTGDALADGRQTAKPRRAPAGTTPVPERRLRVSALGSA